METEYVKSLMTRVVSCHDRDRVLLPVRGVVLSCNCIRLGDVYRDAPATLPSLNRRSYTGCDLKSGSKK